MLSKLRFGAFAHFLRSKLRIGAFAHFLRLWPFGVVPRCQVPSLG